MPRIGVNALYMIPGGVGGTEIYLRSLLAALAGIDRANQYLVFTNRETGAGLVPSAPNFLHVPCGVAAANRPARIVYEQTALAWKARSCGVLFNPGYTAPVLAPCPQVAVFHDMQHKRHPEHFRAADLLAWRALLWASAHRAAHLIADSAASRDDVIRYYGLPPDRVTEVPLGVDEAFFDIGTARRDDCKSEGTNQTLLCVSTLHPHKNIERLLRVFARLHARHPRWLLTLAGMRGFQTEAIEHLIAELGLGSFVRITGWIPREELHALYRTADAFVYPSTFEGFGIPVIEALAAAIPLACSSIEPLRTLAGDAALTFDPLDETAMEAALHRLLSGRWNGRRGPAQAARYRWESAARSTLAILESAATGSRTSRVNSR
ncbi:MAG: glycosyltransferase family 1 protein [Bryobacteraceae bacterium]